MLNTPEYNFWNKPEVVKEFYEYEPSPYWRDFLVRLKNPASYKALDLGSGGGRNTKLLIELGFNSWACDLYESMVKSTRKKLAKVIPLKEIKKKVIMSSILKLPFKKDTFDIIIANGVYHNTNSYKEFSTAVKETGRILKTGGFLCINVFYRGVVAPELREIKNNANTFITKEGLHMTLLSRSKILKILKQTGLIPAEKIYLYNKKVSTGLRSVFRGVFKKT